MPLDNRDYMREAPRPEGPGGFISRMDAFQWVFSLNIAVFIIQWLFQIGWVTDPLSGQRIIPMGGVSVDELSRGHVWTPFTYMFVHGSVGHILFNMIMLWFAGRRVHDLFGGRNFLLIFLMAGLAGAALEMTLGALFLQSTSITLIGASACCMGLLLAYAAAMPDEPLTLLLFFIVPVRVTMRGIARFLLLMNAALGVLTLLGVLPGWLSGGGGAVAYWAHIGGALAGWYYARGLGYDGLTSAFIPRALAAPRPRRQPVGARARRPRVEVDMEAVRRQNPAKDPVVDLMRDEVDPILDKISAHGMHSLTEEERRTLERASRRIGKKVGGDG